MTNQDNIENEPVTSQKAVRVVRLEIAANRLRVLSFVPSSFLPQVVPLIAQADEIEIRLKINNEIEVVKSEKA